MWQGGFTSEGVFETSPCSRTSTLQDLAWIIVKSCPGLLYASRLISQPGTSHAIATSDGWAIFLVSGEKLKFCSSKTVGDQFPRAEIAKEVALVNAPPLLC